MAFELNTLKDTGNFAKLVAGKLKENDLILLFGELGSGKTTFVKYLAKEMGYNSDNVSSPSFTIIQEYNFSTKKICHIDLYRIEKESDLIELGLEEILSGQFLVVVEWPEIGINIFKNCGRKIFEIHFNFKSGKRTADLTIFDI